MFARLLRLPALHFVLIGAALFVATSGAPRRPASAAPARPPIVIPASTIEELRREHREITGAPPTAGDLSRLVEREVGREILYREALLLGLDRADPAVDRRVIEKVRFLYGDDAGTDAEALERGRELGLDRDDVVVRRTLVTKMRLLAKRASRTREPEGPALEYALEETLARETERYEQPPTVSLVHVFFNAARTHARADAEALRQRLQAPLSAAAAAAEGDPSPLGHDFQHRSERGLAKIFGPDFAAAALRLDAGTWSPPVRSSYGTHLVWIADKQPARVPPLAEVRSRVLRAYRAAQHEVFLAELTAALRGLYEVRIETRDDA